MFQQHLLLDHGSDEGDVQDMQPHPRDTVSTLLDGYLYHKNAPRSALIRVTIDLWWLMNLLVVD
jgi:hypothetical protein